MDKFQKHIFHNEQIDTAFKDRGYVKQQIISNDQITILPADWIQTPTKPYLFVHVTCTLLPWIFYFETHLLFLEPAYAEEMITVTATFGEQKTSLLDGSCLIQTSSFRGLFHLPSPIRRSHQRRIVCRSTHLIRH